MCPLCQIKLNEKDIKISKRMVNYAKDCGGDRYKRLVSRVFEALETIKIGGQQVQRVDT